MGSFHFMEFSRVYQARKFSHFRVRSRRSRSTENFGYHMRNVMYVHGGITSKESISFVRFQIKITLTFYSLLKSYGPH